MKRIKEFNVKKNNKGITFIVLSIAIIVLILIITSILLIINSNDNDNIIDEQEGYTENRLQEGSENSNEKKVTNKYNFWIDNYKNWNVQKEDFSYSLLDGKFTAPIDLSTADSFAKQYLYSTNQERRKYTQTIKDALNSEGEIAYSCDIWIQYGELNEHGSYNKSRKIDVRNYNYDPKNEENNSGQISLKQAIDNNWWYIENCMYTDALGISSEEYYNHENPCDNSALLDQIVEILGGPAHIYIGKKEDESIKYLLEYEYSDFILSMEIEEGYIGEMYYCECPTINYYTKECFEKELEETFFKYEKLK